MTSNEVPQLLRFKDLQRLGVVATWPGLRDLQVNCGFPLGRLLGPQTRVWSATEVNAWLLSRPVEPSEQTKIRAQKSIEARKHTARQMLDQEDGRAA